MLSTLHRPFCLCASLVLTSLPASLWAQRKPLLPAPQQIAYGAGVLRVESIRIVPPTQGEAPDQFAAQVLAAGLRAATGQEVSVSSAGGGPTITLKRSGDLDELPRKDEMPGPGTREAYQIRVTTSGAEIQAKSSAGLYYGVQTLLQLIEKRDGGTAIPEVTIDDWPTLAYRGVMMDLSHGPLPTESEVKKQIDFLARWKANQYYFYSELSIEMRGYPLINPNGRYSQDAVRRIVAYARERHVDVVPCLEFYGHLHDLFRLERYANLAPLTHGTEINPVNPRMQELMADWATQMAALFPSPWFHIGLDEPWELQRAGSAAAGGVAPEKLYVDHLKRMSALLTSKGKRVLFWADINEGADLFNKYPNMMADLPKDVVPVPWQYAAQKDYTSMVAPFHKANFPEIIAGGIDAWDSLTPNYDITFTNIDGYVRDGRANGTLGFINTDWSDAAQILFRMTMPGIAYGAAASWQAKPMYRTSFFTDYAAQMYSPETAVEVAAALASMTKAQVSIASALGHEDALRIWDDPLMSANMARARSHVADLQTARLASEDAQEHLYKAIALSGDTYSLPSLLFGARFVDYAGMKSLYAMEIQDVYGKVNAKSDETDVEFWLNRQASSRNHSRIADLMDTITELREVYRGLWLAENTDFRLGTIIGRFDAEYEYWRRLQQSLWYVERTYRKGATLPPLESLQR